MMVAGPLRAASATAKSPSGPEPWISTLWRGCKRPRRSKPCTTVRNGTGRGRGERVRYHVRHFHPPGGRKDVAVLAEASGEIGILRAAVDHVPAPVQTERRLVFHDAVQALAAEAVRPDDAVAFAQRRSDGILLDPPRRAVPRVPSSRARGCAGRLRSRRRHPPPKDARRWRRSSRRSSSRGSRRAQVAPAPGPPGSRCGPPLPGLRSCR